MNEARGTFDTTSWVEETWDEPASGTKLTRAVVANRFLGDIQGESVQELLMTYVEGRPTRFHGIERVRGRLGEREGAFVLEHTGTAAPNTAGDEWIVEATWRVVSGSGSDGLRGLRGEGSYRWDGRESRYTLEYAFAPD